MTDQPEPRTQDGNVYEMLWDCEFCGNKKLLGKTHRFCPACGAPQNPEWRYFPSDDEKVAVKDHRYVGADKLCGSCGTAASGDAEYCGRCGAPLAGAQEAKRQATRIRAEGAAAFQTENLQARLEQQRDAEVFRGVSADVMKSGIGKWWYILGGVVVLAVVFILLLIFWKDEQTVTVTDHQWEREISIQQLRAENERSSCESVPSGAYNVDRRYEQVDTRRVPDGERCDTHQVDQGDGTFRQERVCETIYRDEPVMGYRCYYTINRWRNSRSVESSGGLNDPLTWPDPRFSCTEMRVGCEREGGRDERFLLILQNPESKTYTCPFSESDWRAIPVGTQYTVKVGVISGDVDCGSLERAGS